MAEHRERTQLLGDFIREGAVLIAVLYPLEALIGRQFDWANVVLAEVIAGTLLYWGTILEGREEL